MEEGEVVGVARHFGSMVGRGDVAWIGEGGEVEEEVGENDRDSTGYFGESAYLGPDYRKIEVLAADE